jgi:glycosyltransferase involved in cell wall biosynthesis
LAARVALLTEQLRRPVPGGIGTYTRGLLQGLRELGDDLGNSVLDVRPWASRLPVALRTRLWDRGIGRINADIVHAPSFSFPRTRGALVVVVHDLAWQDAPETFPKRGRAWHERGLQRTRREATHVVAPSERTAARVIEAGIEPSRVTVIEEGCDHLPPPDTAGAARVFPGEFLLAVGTREPRKNLARLVEAFEQARPALGDAGRLVVVGPEGWGPAGAWPDGVTVAGQVSDAVLAGLYVRARAFVYVPLVEGFGLPPVEAMRAGAPVVASTAVPSTAGAALEVDATDVGAIAEAIVTAVTDDAARADLVRRGTARAAALTWREAARHHLALWEAVAR